MTPSPPTPLTRRSALTVGGSALAALLAACGGDAKKPASSTSTTSASTGAAGVVPTSVTVSPVDGFSATPSWASTQNKDLIGWMPVEKLGATWFQDRAWMVVTNGTETRVLAFDPAAKTTALSANLPGSTWTQEGNGQYAAAWWPIVAPSAALILTSNGTDLFSVTRTGSTITLTPMPANPVHDGSGVQPKWIGDGIAAVSQNKTMAATGDSGDAANPLTSSYYLDAGKKTWVAMRPQHNGTICGISVTGSTITPVEIYDGASGYEPKVYVGSTSFDSSFRTQQTAMSGADPLPITDVTWSHDGTLFMTVSGSTNHYMSANNGSYVVAYGQDGKPRTALDSTKGWSTGKGTYVLTQNGVVLNLTTGHAGAGVHTDNQVPQWDIDTATVTDDGTIYATASTNPGDVSQPSGGSYVSTTGVLDPAKHTDKTAPTLVLPDGSGVFFTTSGVAVLPKH